MKLIYARGACSLSVHILLEELGLDYEGIEVSLRDKTVLNQYNPKGYVPALVLDNGQVLTEAINILQYLEESNHDSTYLPAPGTLERARCLEWATFFSTEIHKGLGPLFYKEKLTPQLLTIVTQKLESRLNYFNEHLKNNKFLMDKLTIADMYAIAILRIAEHVGIDLTKFSEIYRYKKMMEQEVPSVQTAIDLEEHPLNVKREERSTDPIIPIESMEVDQMH